MKRKLLYSILSTVLFTGAMSAQTKTWDFGNDTTTWPLSSGIGSTEIVVDNLGLFPIATNTNFGAVTANAYTFSDGFTTVNRFQLNGGGGAGTSFLPTQRYLYFTATGACTVKIWFRTGSAGARSLFVTDGTSLIASAGSVAADPSGTPFILTANVTASQAAAGKIYIYGDQAQNLYKMTVTGATVNTTLANNSFESELDAVVYANKGQVYVSKIASETSVNVYTITGQLVKTLNTSADVDFQLNKGIYVVNLSSTEGKKTVKLIVN